MSNEPNDRFKISADEMEFRLQMLEKYRNKPMKNVTELIAEAIRRVLATLGIDVTQSDEMVIQQQVALGVFISERPPEEMGELSGFYVIARGTPIAIIGDPYLASDGLAYLDIKWIQKEHMEVFGGVRVIQ